jgi:hypothetical protein
MVDKHYQLGIDAQKYIAELFLVLEHRLRTDDVGEIYLRLEFKKRSNSKQCFS